VRILKDLGFSAHLPHGVLPSATKSKTYLLDHGESKIDFNRGPAARKNLRPVSTEIYFVGYNPRGNYRRTP
jgi:hypothetical protein